MKKALFTLALAAVMAGAAHADATLNNVKEAVTQVQALPDMQGVQEAQEEAEKARKAAQEAATEQEAMREKAESAWYAIYAWVVTEQEMHEEALKKAAVAWKAIRVAREAAAAIQIAQTKQAEREARVRALKKELIAQTERAEQEATRLKQEARTAAQLARLAWKPVQEAESKAMREVKMPWVRPHVLSAAASAQDKVKAARAKLEKFRATRERYMAAREAARAQARLELGAEVERAEKAEAEAKAAAARVEEAERLAALRQSQTMAQLTQLTQEVELEAAQEKARLEEQTAAREKAVQAWDAASSAICTTWMGVDTSQAEQEARLEAAKEAAWVKERERREELAAEVEARVAQVVRDKLCEAAAQEIAAR